MMDAYPLSNTKGIAEVLHKSGFTLSPREGSRLIDEQISLLRIDPMRQVAACFGTPALDQNKGKFQLGACVMK